MEEATSYSFKVIGNTLTVSFQVPDTDYEQYYDIAPLRLLDETMIEEDGSSQLIFHLEMKSWVPVSLLYDLAAQIVKYHPENEIDWEKSLFDAELSRAANKYTDENYVMSHTDPDMLELNYVSQADAVKRTMMAIDYCQDIPKEMAEEIRARVSEELGKRGIF